MSGTPTQSGLDVGDVGVDQAQLPPLDPAVERQPIDLRGWFDEPLRNHPLELEIGSGKGTFLVNQARAVPDVNFIGIEYARAFWRYAADRVRRHGLRNVKLVHTEAGAFVRNYVGDGVLRQVHIYFPDPWPKKRHNKRRLVQAPFLRELWRVLTPEDPTGRGGRIRIATDHADYFAWMEAHAAEVADLFDRQPFERPTPGSASGNTGMDEGELVGTNFERKYRREGRSFYGMVLVKRPTPGPGGSVSGLR